MTPEEMASDEMREIRSKFVKQGIDDAQLTTVSLGVQTIDYRCDDRRFWLSAHDWQVPTPTSQNLDLEQQIRIFKAD